MAGVKERSIYENLYRPNYELMAIMVWVLAGALGLIVHWVYQMPPQPLALMTIAATILLARRAPKAVKILRFHKSLKGHPISFISLAALAQKVKALQKKARKKKMKESSGLLWLGYGFEWDQPHAQRLHDLMSREKETVVQVDESTMGSPWIHAMGLKERDLLWSLDSAGLMTGIFGATGSGKTRLIDLVINQLVLMNQCVIAIDPKGDKDTEDNLRRACKYAGRTNDFYMVHRAHPSESTRIDMMANYTNGAELASRIVALMPSGGDDSFKNFAFMAVNNAIQGILASGENPSFVNIKNYLESDMDGLVINAISGYAKTIQDPETAQIDIDRILKASSLRSAQVKGMKEYYRSKLKPIRTNPDLEGVLHMIEHDREHLSKIIMNIFPILTSLTTGPMGSLLSPNPEDATDRRGITDIRQIVENNGVAYFGLDTLSDQMTGQSMGSFLLADLAAFAGSTYNYTPESERRPVNIIIDEAAEITNDQLIQLLNKSRGAGFRVFVLTQSIADFEAKTGSAAKAKQILDNINNMISLRITGNETQEYITENIPKCRINTIMLTQGTNSAGGSPIEHTGNIGERLIPEEVSMLPPQAMGLLPNLEYIAKLSGGRILKGRIPILQD